jgi:polyisoprenoid-binding protein YceI
MKKTILFLSFLALTGTSSIFAQKKTTSSAIVAFDASTSVDALPKAENKTVVDPRTGSIAFEATVKNFTFSNPMMQDHFNGSSWMSSDEHPTFTYKGSITDLAAINFTKDGVYQVKTEGVLKIKGVEQKLSTPATITVKGNTLIATTNFTIKLSDFGITGAPIDGGKVAKEPKITVNAELK